MGETAKESKKNLNPYFRDFFTGQSLEEVNRRLMSYQAILKEEESKSFRMDVPLFLYLSLAFQGQNLHIDIQKERVYLDDVHFVDFRDEMIQKKSYDFFYENNFYYMLFHEIKSYQVNYPDRVNPYLKQIRFKFFQNKLYAIEYTASLKSHQINRLKQNYLENYGIKLEKKETTFSTDRGLYVVQILSKRKEVRVIATNRLIYNQIEKYLESQVGDLTSEIARLIEEKLNTTVDLKKLLLQEKKRVIKEKIEKVYRFVDDF